MKTVSGQIAEFFDSPPFLQGGVGLVCGPFDWWQDSCEDAATKDRLQGDSHSGLELQGNNVQEPCLCSEFIISLILTD